MKKLALEATELCSTCKKSLILCDCAPRELRNVGYSGITAPFAYSTSKDSVSKTLILRLKKRDIAVGFQLIASLIAPALEARYGWLVTSVPRRWKSVDKFGFDQAGKLAKALADELDCEYAVTLRRSGETVQKELSYAERKLAASKSYETVGDRFKGRRVILVDDIITSGSTMAECTKLLLDGGAKMVHIVAAARTIHEIKEEQTIDKSVGAQFDALGE